MLNRHTGVLTREEGRQAVLKMNWKLAVLICVTVLAGAFDLLYVWHGVMNRLTRYV